MLKNYFVVAVRSLRRRKAYAFLNVTGLAVGMACCLLIALYVRQELSYDRFHEHVDRLYRIGREGTSPEHPFQTAWTMPVLAPTLEAEVPEVEAVARISWNENRRLLRRGDRAIEVDDLLLADAAFFRLFSFPLRRGDPEAVLVAPGSLVLTETTARRLFGDEDPVGQVVLADNHEDLTVTGVVADPPLASHLAFSGLVSFSTWAVPEATRSNALTNWSYTSVSTYVLLRPGATRAALERQLAGIVDRHMAEMLRAMNAEETLRAEPLTDVRLRSGFVGPGTTGRMESMYVFSLVAAFILVLACVNFTNLATARSAERAREVGVRKTVGARRSSLALQFLGEAVLLSAVSCVFALALAEAARPAFEALAGGPVAWNLGWAEYLVLAGTVVFVGVLAGFYPAVVLSRFQPARVLKGAVDVAGRRDRLRRSLVVVQFSIAVALIAATAVVFRQVDYMQRQDLGFDMDAAGELLVVELPRDGSLDGRLDVVLARFAAHPDVLGVTASATTPADGNYWGAGGDLEREDGSTSHFAFRFYPVDETFPAVYGLRVVAGRAFSGERATDSTAAFLFNEAAVTEAGFTSAEAAVGRRISFWGASGEVVGVVRDFHASGLQEAVGPMVLGVRPSFRNLVTLRVRPGDPQRTIGALEATWQALAPEWPFAYRFLDERFDAQYEAEQRFGRLFATFAGLAVLIACLGLFGLAAFTVEQRAKEIGIRKVLGASAGGIVVLLTRDLVVLVLASLAVAVPVAYFAMQRWLEGFAYRTDVGAGVFVAAGTVVLVVALGTTGVQAARAALRNPVHALRTE